MISEGETLTPTSAQVFHSLHDDVISIRSFPIKRLFDVAFSSTALIVGLPLFLVIAAGIKVTSKGPIFYADRRIGRGGKTFNCYKFRTMAPQACEELKRLLESDSKLHEEWVHKRKLTLDPRVTRFGRLLRRMSLDELPQFLNVLKGDLSVVGPRPVTNEEIGRYYGFKAKKILQVRPGITGIWQTRGRSDTTYEERILMDEYYVDSRSFGMDLMLVLKTIPAVLRSRGAY